MIKRIALILIVSLLFIPNMMTDSSDAESSTYTVTIGYVFEYEESLDQKYTYAENTVPYGMSAETKNIMDPFGNVYLYNSISDTFWSKSEGMYMYDSDHNGCFDLGCYISDDGTKGYFVHDGVYYYSKGSDNEKAMQDHIYTSNKPLPEHDLVLESVICMYKIEPDRDRYLFFNNVEHRDQTICLIEPSVVRFNKCAGEEATLRIDSEDKSLKCYPSTENRGTIVTSGIGVGETAKLDYYTGMLSLTFSTEDLANNLTISVDITTQGLKSIEDTGDNNIALLITSIVIIIVCILLAVILLLLKYKR